MVTPTTRRDDPNPYRHLEIGGPIRAADERAIELIKAAEPAPRSRPSQVMPGFSPGYRLGPADKHGAVMPRLLILEELMMERRTVPIPRPIRSRTRSAVCPRSQVMAAVRRRSAG